jgi:hypothetical protein
VWAASPAGQAYAIDQFNLWGTGTAASWGEKYFTAGNTVVGAEGMSDWKLISAPAGWTGPNGIVKGNDPWSADATHAFPVWRVGTGTPLSQANMNDPQFVWTFQVLVANVETAFEADGKLKVFWGGADNSSPEVSPTTGASDDVAGIMRLDATPVPEPLTMLAVFGGVSMLGGYIRRRRAA